MLIKNRGPAVNGLLWGVQQGSVSGAEVEELPVLGPRVWVTS